jgi:hypothetical protein
VEDGEESRPGLIARVFGVRAKATPPLLPQPADRGVLGEDSGALVSSLPFDWGASAGWLDPNTQFTPEYLHGDWKSPGKLLEIRRTDDVISPAMDSRRELLASFGYEVRPRPRMLKSARAQTVAIKVGARLASMPDTSVPWFVSQAYDHWGTSGFDLSEITLDELDRLELSHIRPGLIRRFNPDATGRMPASVTIQTRQGDKTIDFSKFSYFARNPEPGEYRGQSAIRCMVATSETTLQLYSALLQSIRYSMGFPYLSDTGQGKTTDADKNNALESMSKLLKGVSDVAYFGRKVEPKMLASVVPAMQSFAPLAQFQAERKQAAAMNALNNLGMRGVGSRSLGEVVHDADQRALRAHLDLFMKTISGDSYQAGTLMRTLTELEGEHPDLAPEIVIRWDDGSAERKSRDHIALVAQLVKDGVLAQSPDLDAWIRQQLQVPNG